LREFGGALQRTIGSLKATGTVWAPIALAIFALVLPLLGRVFRVFRLTFRPRWSFSILILLGVALLLFLDETSWEAITAGGVILAIGFAALGWPGKSIPEPTKDKLSRRYLVDRIASLLRRPDHGESDHGVRRIALLV